MKGSVPTGRQRSQGAWLGLGLLALLFLGLWASGQMGHESAAYGFGIAMVVVGFVMVPAAGAGAPGRVMRRRKKGTD